MENFNKEEKEYSKAISALKSLKKISAKPNFEADLMRRINAEKFGRKESFFQNILWGKVFVPSAAALALLVIMFALVLPDADKEINADPFSEMPKVREDVIVQSNDDIAAKQNEVIKKKVPKDKVIISSPPIDKNEFADKEEKSVLSESFSLKKSDDTIGGIKTEAPALFFRATAVPDSEKKKLDSLKNIIFKDSLR